MTASRRVAGSSSTWIRLSLRRCGRSSARSRCARLDHRGCDAGGRAATEHAAAGGGSRPDLTGSGHPWHPGSGDRLRHGGGSRPSTGLPTLHNPASPGAVPAAAGVHPFSAPPGLRTPPAPGQVGPPTINQGPVAVSPGAIVHEPPVINRGGVPPPGTITRVPPVTTVQQAAPPGDVHAPLRHTVPPPPVGQTAPPVVAHTPPPPPAVVTCSTAAPGRAHATATGRRACGATPASSRSAESDAAVSCTATCGA